MSSNEYLKVKQISSRYQPRALKKSLRSTSPLINQDLVQVLPDLHRHNFTKTVLIKGERTPVL